MGYKRNPKVYRLTFAEDTDYPGLEVQVRTLSLGQLLAIRAKGQAGEDATSGMVDLFADRLVAWNLEAEDGTPVPATREAVEAEDDDMILAVINRWQEAMAGVPAPLDSGSPSGPPSAVESMLTEIPSESLAS